MWFCMYAFIFCMHACVAYVNVYTNIMFCLQEHRVGKPEKSVSIFGPCTALHIHI